MDITSKILVRLGVSRALAAKYAEQLDRQLETHGINTHLRCAHFLAQVLHESTRLSRIRENLNYSKTGLRKTFPKYFSEQPGSTPHPGRGVRLSLAGCSENGGKTPRRGR